MILNRCKNGPKFVSLVSDDISSSSCTEKTGGSACFSCKIVSPEKYLGWWGIPVYFGKGNGSTFVGYVWSCSECGPVVMENESSKKGNDE